MSLDATDLQAIELMLARHTETVVARVVSSFRSTSMEGPTPRFSTKDFATAVGMHVETILSKIRVGSIPAHLVFGERPKMISAKALDLFGVTPQEALARVEAKKSQPVLLQFEA